MEIEEKLADEPTGDAAVALCCICLEPQEDSKQVLSCPAGHLTCREDLANLAIFNAQPARLRRLRGMIQCPHVTEGGNPCEHQFSYRSIHGLLPEEAQIGYTEGVLDVMGALMEGRFGDSSSSISSSHHQHHHCCNFGKSMPEDDDYHNNKNDRDPELAGAIQHVLSSILNLRCPACHTAFFDFDACR